MLKGLERQIDSIKQTLYLVMNKYVKYSIILGFTVFALAYIYYELFNQLLISTNNSLEANNTTIQFILLITGIITIIFLYINYDQQRQQIKSQQKELEENRKESEFNKVVQLVQNQLLFTKEALLNKTYNSKDLLRIKDIDISLAGYYFDLVTIIYRQTNVYKRYLDNSLDLRDKKLIFSIICTNFLDNYIDDITHIYKLYENTEGSLHDKINRVVLDSAKASYSNYYMVEEIEISDEDALSDNPEYYQEQRRKLFLMKNMIFDIKTTYDLHTEILTKNI